MSAAHLGPKLGVIKLSGWGGKYVPLLGDVDDEHSWNSPIIHAYAEGVTFETLCDDFIEPALLSRGMKQLIFDGVTRAVQRLVKLGAGSIIANCGLFMWLHATGIIDAAVDEAMSTLPDSRRPTVALSSLVMLPAYLPTLGLGKHQRAAHQKFLSFLPASESKCRVVVFTSNGKSCKPLIEAVPQLEAEELKVFYPSDEIEGDVLVVGLDGNLQDLIEGLDGSLPGFDAVKDGTPVDYSLVQKGVKKVAKAVKKKYPNIVLAVVECTQVSSFSDTIKSTMNVNVLDPVKVGSSALELCIDHDFVQLSPSERLEQIKHKLMMRDVENLEDLQRLQDNSPLLTDDGIEEEVQKLNKKRARPAGGPSTAKKHCPTRLGAANPTAAGVQVEETMTNAPRNELASPEEEMTPTMMRETHQNKKLRKMQIELLMSKSG